MDDLTRALTFGLLTLLTIHGSIEDRARRSAERQVRESFQYTGSVRAEIQGRGLFGVEANDFWSVDIYGMELRSDRLPFYVYPRPGWKGSIRHLRLHLKRFTLKGLPIRAFDADIPFATYDIGHALYKGRLVLRGTGAGPATVEVDAAGLRAFINKKFRDTITDVNISFPGRRILIEGKIRLFSDYAPFSAMGTLVPRAGRFLDLADPEMRLNGVLMTTSGTQNLLRQINPVLDADADLGLGGYFEMERVEVKDDEIVITGRASIPVAPSPVPTGKTGN